MSNIRICVKLFTILAKLFIVDVYHSEVYHFSIAGLLVVIKF